MDQIVTELHNQDKEQSTIHYNDLVTIVQKLRHELEEKENEISGLKKMILKQKQDSALDSNQESNNCQGHEEKEKSTEPCFTMHSYNRAGAGCMMHSKEILFHGRKDDGKPRRNNIVQIHYTITSANKPTVASTLTNPSEQPTQVIIEDSRGRRDGKPFEFILGAGQIIQEWEEVIEDMYCGEVITVKMAKSHHVDDSKTMYSQDHNEYLCRIELIRFWENDECKGLID